MLARDALSIDDLNELIAVTDEPEKLKLLLAALQRAIDKVAAEAEQMENEARQLQEAAQAARARVLKAEEVSRQIKDLICALLEEIGAQEAGQRPAP